MADYAIYLRKSRADIDAEARGEGETLSKHRAALTAFARQRGLVVIREYAEIVSGDTIAARPQMQQLLSDVKAGLYAGVIVNDVDRLGRGDSIDQEIIKYTFAAAGCKIITPGRDIDPASPSDQDMLDFSMFFARMEYRKISQRLRQGRLRAAEGGSYVSAAAPVGYDRVKVDGKVTLRPNADADTVRMVFRLYLEGASLSAIVKRLTDMGIRTVEGNYYSRIVIKRMLANETYTGALIYGKTQTARSVDISGARSKLLRTHDPIVIPDAFEAIIPRETFEAVQARLPSAPVHTDKTIRNPLAGLVFCSQCGRAMQLHRTKRLRIECKTPYCVTRGALLDDVIAAVLDTLKQWQVEYVEPSHDTAPDNTPDMQRRIATLKSQLARAQELVELGAYTPGEYVQRRETLTSQIAALEAEMTRAEPPDVFLPKIRHVLDAYEYAETPAEQNGLLRTIIKQVVYSRSAKGKPIMLDVYPVLSCNT